MFAIDTGSTGGEGPWLVWAARPTHDGAIPARTFYVRDKDGGKTPVDMTQGAVLDLDSLKTGWQQSEGMKGVAPKWQFGASPAQLPPQPGEDWKKGFSVRVGLKDGTVVMWEQAGAAAWACLGDLAPGLMQRPGAQAPVVVIDGVKEHNFTRGSTAQPVLRVVKWIDTPPALSHAPQIATAPATAPAAPAPASAPVAGSAPSW
jgi:hypothetical protein